MLKRIRATIILLGLMLTFSACKKDKSETVENALVGDWRLMMEEYVPTTTGSGYTIAQNSLQLRFFSATRFSRYEEQAQPALSAYDWFDGDYTINNGTISFTYDRAVEKKPISFTFNKTDATHCTLTKDIVTIYGEKGRYTYSYVKVR